MNNELQPKRFTSMASMEEYKEFYKPIACEIIDLLSKRQLSVRDARYVLGLSDKTLIEQISDTKF